MTGSFFCTGKIDKIWLINYTLIKILFICLFVCLSFVILGPHPQHMEVPRLGVELSYSCQPTPQPQQLGIRALSATAHGNTGSLTHWLRPGIKPITSWFLVGFVSAASRWELWKWHSWWLLIKFSSKLLKRVQHHSLLEKCKPKPLWGSTLHHPEWPLSKVYKQ